MSLPSGADPLDPRTILQTCRQFTQYVVYESLPNFWNSISELPSKTAQAYIERDRRFDARQGPIGDPYKGWIDPGLADGIEERRAKYEEYLERRKKEKAKENVNGESKA
jgi:cobalamin biosynthesis Mg chelatase CobN